MTSLFLPRVLARQPMSRGARSPFSTTKIRRPTSVADLPKLPNLDSPKEQAALGEK
jgi:hypothetical protein